MQERDNLLLDIQHHEYLNMSLKFPDSDIEFVVTPAYFLGDFDVYDREETLGEYLSQFDPNDFDQLSYLLDEKFFNGGRLSKFSLEHKYELLKMLAQALSDSSYDFDSVIYERDDYFCLPYSWVINNPRLFFEIIYLKMYKHWGSDLITNGFDVIKPKKFTI
ncbi:hypothetical protein SAMN02745781_03156 [Vibrio gazogenes DSM 21264]|uniref:Uncharacterized protein n=2 Tax=Vibrio gazogenes TaxID=687 RepID=A0A1M5EI22_VIBGA|nr:hypothetical protein SAMN02745781_03156 [Vibrio gazogenes DSM 21264] [Vibrio gazogenes DSM 21264 = NBRC 103151]SJN53979.1 hypothetical protein BQ6471_00748 [Vibrio gazogenes]